MVSRGAYREIAAGLRQLICNGSLKPGEMIPSESALAAAHGVARGTVRAALAVLADEGLLETLPGQGRRVAGGAVKGDPTTAYGRIAMDLGKRIRSGEFARNDLMPSEAALVVEYGVARSTVRRAYQMLVDEGLVMVRHGSGAFSVYR